MLKYPFTRKEEIRFLAKFVLVLLLIYICLFQFILPANKVLPMPAMLAESFISIWSDYNLLFSLAVTVSVVYLAMAAAYGIVYLLKGVLSSIYFSHRQIISAFKIFKYFPAFLYAVLFDYWFTGSYYAEFAFAVIAASALMINHFLNELDNVKEDYIVFAAGLGVKENTIVSKILWNSAKDAMLRFLKRVNFYIWVVVLIFEYIANVEGIGHVYNRMLAYRDLAGLIAAAIIISVIIYGASKLIDYLYSKLIHWEKEEGQI